MIYPTRKQFIKLARKGNLIPVYREVMADLAKLRVSSTLGGETLSLAATKAALGVYRREDVIGRLWRQGERLWGGLNELFARHGVPARMEGLWPCPQMVFAADAGAELGERFFRAAYRSGVSLFSVCYVNYSVGDEDVSEALERLDEACRHLRRGGAASR